MKVRTSVAEVDTRARVLKEEHKPVTKTEFEYYEDFWDFCFYECPIKGLALCHVKFLTLHSYKSPGKAFIPLWKRE